MKVTVILTTYNHERFIALSLNSILMQETDFDFEIIVIDDFSTDNTREILDLYKRENPGKVKLQLNVQNRCDNSAQMELLESTQSDYVALLDGDDCWTSTNKLQKQIEIMERSKELAISFHNVVAFYENETKKPYYYHKRYQQETLSLSDLFYHNFIAGCTPVLRTNAIPSMPEWYQDCVYGDWPLYMLVAQNGPIRYINEVMGVYRIHDGGIFSNLSVRQQYRQVVKYLEEMNLKFDRNYEQQVEESISWFKNEIEKLDHLPSDQEASIILQPKNKISSAYWPASLMLGRGEDACQLLDNLLCDKSEIDVNPIELASIIYRGAPMSLFKETNIWSELWPQVKDNIENFVFSIEYRAGLKGLTEKTISHLLGRIK